MNATTTNENTPANSASERPDPIQALRCWTYMVGVPRDLDHLVGAFRDLLGEIGIERLYGPAGDFLAYWQRQDVLAFGHTKLAGGFWPGRVLAVAQAHIEAFGPDVPLVRGGWGDKLPERAEQLFEAMRRFLLVLGVDPHAYPAEGDNMLHFCAAVDTAGDPDLRRALLRGGPARFLSWFQADDVGIYERTALNGEEPVDENDPDGARWKFDAVMRLRGLTAWA